MKKIYSLLLLITAFNLNAQTTVNYPQRVANYDAFFSDNGGNFDNGADEFGMWANGSDPKQSVAWRAFTQEQILTWEVTRNTRVKRCNILIRKRTSHILLSLLKPRSVLTGCFYKLSLQPIVKRP